VKTLRDYQQEAIDAVFSEWERGVGSTLLVAATGLGKTVVAGEICSRLVADRKRVLFLSHRQELMQQSAKVIGGMTGEEVAREGAEYKELLLRPKSMICSGMVQSVVRRLNRFEEKSFDVVIVDEAHHSVAKTYRKILEHIDPERILGVTATPKRGDDKAMGQVFDTVAYEMGIADGIEQGWLTPVKSRIVPARDMDLRNINMVAGELNQRALKEQLLKQAVVDKVARSSVEISDGRQMVIFAQNIEQSKAICRVLKQMGERAVHVDGKLPHYSRRNRMGEFADGKVQFICNCSVIEEGVDVPGIEVVGQASPTMSQIRVIQRVGRGLRPIDPPAGGTPNDRRAEIANSTKPHCTVVDFVGTMGSKILQLSGDILGGEYEDDVREEAIKIAMRWDGDIDWDIVHAEAQEIVKRRGAVQKKLGGDRAKERLWCMKHNPCPYDVLGIRKEDARQVSKDDCNGGNLSRAVSFLEKERLQIKDYGRLCNYEQVMLARVIWKRSRQGLCTYRQARMLYLYGYGTEWSVRDASRIIDRIKQEGWIRPYEDGPNQVFLAATGRATIEGN